MKNNLKNMLKKYREQIVYLLFGGLTTVINWLVYTGLVLVGQGIAFANTLAWIVAVLFAYFTNRSLVFQSRNVEKKAVIKEFFIFIGSRVATGMVELIGFPLLYYMGMKQTIFGIDGFVAKVIISVIVIILNYIMSKLVVFRKV